jgi:hypothetical protein
VENAEKVNTDHSPPRRRNGVGAAFKGGAMSRDTGGERVDVIRRDLRADRRADKTPADNVGRDTGYLRVLTFRICY